MGERGRGSVFDTRDLNVVYILLIDEWDVIGSPLLVTVVCIATLITSILLLLACADLCRRHAGFKVCPKIMSSLFMLKT